MRSNPFTGRYLFHLHTTYTDGKLTVREYFEFAVQARLDRLIFLEHIRAVPSYDVARFVAEVRACAAEFAMPALVGFEAKVLPGGGLDISAEHADLADVLGIAEHGFPGDFAQWHVSVRRALESFADKPRVWVHPGLWLKKNGLLAAHEQAYRELLRYAVDLGVLVERNLRYGLAPEGSVLGADAHRLADVEACVALMEDTAGQGEN